MKKKKVLLIEDDALTLLVLENFLKDKGLEVVALNDGRSYQSKMEDIDVVILDCGLPFVSGSDIARDIKVNYPSVKVILTSISEEFELQTSALEIADGFIGKPYNQESINYMLQSITDQ